MNGLGNDFVVLDARQSPLVPGERDARLIADRSRGVGCDQIIVLEPSRRADVFMRILNADGSEVDACGNATRCVGSLVMAETGAARATIETSAGLLLAEQGDEPHSVAVDMGRPRLAWHEIPLALQVADTATVPFGSSQLGVALPPVFSAVSMGNPHAVFFVEDVEAHELSRIGPILEHAPLFPQRANISLVEVLSRTHLRQKVWERGAGLTLACGTGACAAAVAAIRAGLADPRLTVSLPGGDLTIEWRADGHVVMTGAASLDYQGRLSFEPGTTSMRKAG
ncbi:MAG: diaminopimelate epimerase [Beijerinckiaceae bacterium]|nr:diaminopimelate epimerase [Beijerinckiaceae bacterium]